MARQSSDPDARGQEPSDNQRAKIDAERPNSARMYDYYLGGSSNFAVDRTEASRVLEAFPAMEHWARSNRSFLRRAVSYLIAQGIDQFLDLGSGVPTKGNVHEIAQRENPNARVAYVDYEPVAAHHARRLLDGQQQQRVTITQADIRDPAGVLTAPGVAELLDFSRPVAVLAVAILHALPEQDRPDQILARYRDACVPGSALVLSHGVRTTLTDEQLERFLVAYRNTPTPATFRSVDRVKALLAGYQLVDPGLVLLDHWRPHAPVTETEAVETNCYAAVGLLPSAADTPTGTPAS